MKINSPLSPTIPIAAPAAASQPGVVITSAAPAIPAPIVELLTSWVMGAVPQLGPACDQFAWFMSKRANVVINKWLASKKLAVLEPVSPNGTGCIVLPRDAVEHCRDHRAPEGVGETGVIELLGQLFAHGSPAYAPNPSKGKTGSGYYSQLAMFDATYTALDPSARGETPVGIIEHVGAPFVHLKLITAYWTRPASAATLRGDTLRK